MAREPVDPTKPGAPVNPPSQGRPPISFNDQMQIMQSLMEIQRELATLSTKTDRLISDVEKTDDHIDAIRSKISRFEGIGIAAVILLVAFGGTLWWLIGAQITQLKDQVLRVQTENSTTQSVEEPKP